MFIFRTVIFFARGKRYRDGGAGVGLGEGGLSPPLSS